MPLSRKHVPEIVISLFFAAGAGAVAVAQTDVKGDRALAPSAQQDPDLYVRIVERRRDGIVVCGAKAHTSVSTNANEIIVLPTRAMAEADADYAVSFAVQAATPGLVLLASAYDSAGPQSSHRDHQPQGRATDAEYNAMSSAERLNYARGYDQSQFTGGGR